MTDAQRTAIRKHGENLLRIFPNATERDPVKLCRSLRRLEAQAERVAIAYCNGELPPDHGYDTTWDRDVRRILDKVDAILGYRQAGVPVFVNGDPRGFSLKIEDDWMRENKAVLYQDMGNFGIIAPEINERGE